MNKEQFLALLWLRWRLWANRWRKSSGFGRVLSIILLVLAVALVVGVFVGGVALGWFGLAKAQSVIVFVVADVAVGLFLFFWLIGLMTELQRSEVIDIGKLMHLPVSMPQLFTMNYIASLVAPTIVILFVGAAGLTIGLLRDGPLWLLLLPPVGGLVFAVSAWTYALRGWLGVLMSNPRRKRSIIVGLTVGMMLLGQLPNILLNNSWSRKKMTETAQQEAAKPRSGAEVEALLLGRVREAHRYIPPGWVGLSALNIAEGSPLPALGTTAIFGLVGGAGLLVAFGQARRAYGRATARVKKAAPIASTSAIPATAAIPRRAFNDRDLPLVSADVSALTLAFFRSQTRAPELRMVFASQFIMIIVFGSIFSRSSMMLAQSGLFTPVVPGMIMLTLFGLMQLFGNQFGYDRQSFRCLVLLPTPRRSVLLAKNLAVVPASVVLVVLFLVALAAFGLLNPLEVLGGAALWVAAYLLMSTYGNLLSILIPFRVNPGAMRQTPRDGKKLLQSIALQFATPLVLGPIWLPLAAYHLGGKGPWAVGAATILIVAVVSLAALVYWLALAPMARLLETRERAILEEVTREVE